MSYYNPVDSEGYYNPYNQSAEQGQGLMHAIGGMAKMMGIIGLLNVGGQIITRNLSAVAGSAIKKYSKGSLGKIARTMKTPTLGSIFSQTTPAKKLRNAWKTTTVAKAAARRRAMLNRLRTKKTGNYGLARITSAFKSPASLVGAAGGLWYKRAVQGAGVAYAVDNLLGITHQELGLERKKWYDLPGQVGNAVKWFGYESLYATMFGVAGVASTTVGGLGKAGLKRAFGGEFGKRVIKNIRAVKGPAIIPEGKWADRQLHESVLSDSHSQMERGFVAKSISRLISTGKTASESLRFLNSSIRATPDSIHRAFKNRGTISHKIGKSFEPIRNALRQIKYIDQKNRQFQHSQLSIGRQAGLQMVEALEGLAKSNAGGAPEKVSSLKDFISMTKAKAREMEKPGFLDQVLDGLEPLRNRHVYDKQFWNDLTGSLSAKYNQNEVELLIRTVKNMKAGSHLYRGFGNKIYGAGLDLSAFDPVIAAKRAASSLFGHQFSVPFTDFNFDLAGIFRAHKFLAESSEIDFFQEAPVVRTPAGKYRAEASHIGDLAKGSLDSRYYIYMKNKGWTIFDGVQVDTVKTGRTLEYSAGMSLEKKTELAIINWERLNKSKNVEAVNKAIEKANRGRIFKNKFLNFMQRKFNLSIPERAEGLLNKLSDKLQGKNFSYRQAAGDVFEHNDLTKFSQSIPVIRDIPTHTAQDLSEVLRTKEGLEILAKYSGDHFLRKDLIAELWDDNKLIDIADSLPVEASKWRKRPDAVYAANTIRAFPKQARQHYSVKRLGPLSEMNSYDVLRTNIIEDIFNNRYLNELAGNGETHPLIEAAGELLDKGLVTPRQAEGIKLHAKLTVFRDEGVFGMAGKPIHDPVFGKAYDLIRNRKDFEARAVQEEIINYVSNTDMRRSTIRVNQEKIIEGKVPDFLTDTSPYFSTGDGLFEKTTDYANSMLEGFTNLVEEIIPFRRNPTKFHSFGGQLKYKIPALQNMPDGLVGIINNSKFLATSFLTVSAAGMGFRAVDSLLAMNPLFDDTLLDQGITGGAADVIAKSRLLTAKVSDTLGITGAMKYLDGLMPGSTTTFPGMLVGAAAGKFFGANPFKMMKYIAFGGAINRLASPYITDITKSYEELKAEYEGKTMVPIMKSPTWLLGGTPWQGTKIQGFQPSWYVRAKSRWQSADNLYGSEFRRLIHEPLSFLGFNIGDIIDPYFIERTHFFSRPAPLTGEALEEVPIIGSILGPTIGRLIKPQKTMHQEFLVGSDPEAVTDPMTRGTDWAMRPPTADEGLSLMRHNFGGSIAERSMLMGKFQYTPHKNWAQPAAQDFLERFSHMAGLQGYMGRIAVNKVVGEPTVMPTLETAGRIASMSRAYYDKNLGGMGFLSEPIRRMLIKPDYKRYGLNPIPNLLPNWLPSEFLKGDAYVKIMKGELRLPGDAYLKTHSDVSRDLPARACFTPDTLIDTLDGLVKITDAKTTITNDGTYQNITHLHEKNYDGEMLEIETDKIHKKYNLNVTPNHNIFAIKTNKCRYYKNQSKYRRTCFNCNDKRKVLCFKKNVRDEYDIKEYKTNQLEVGDYLVSPITKISNDISEIDLAELFNTKESYRFHNNKFVDGNFKQVKQKIQIDHKLMSLIGFYLAKGSLSRYQVTFSFNSNEIDYINEVKCFAEEIFNCTSFTRFSKTSNSATITLNSKFARDFFLYFCGKTKTKFINKIIWKTGKDNISSLLLSYIKGDGWYTNNEIGTVSCIQSLSFSIFKLLCSLGFKPSISYRTGKNVFYDKEKRDIKSTKRIDIRLFKKYSSQLAQYLELGSEFDNFIYNGFIPFKIKSIKKYNYTGKVYDLTVENNHNYAVPFMLVHNSMIGGDEKHMIQYFTGLLPPVLKEQYDILEKETDTHEVVQQMLASEGLLIKAEQLVYDVKNDVSGHVDAIIKDGKGGMGKRALEIKTINQQGFKELDGPKWQHVGQLNHYLHNLKLKKGKIMYVNRDNPAMIKTYDVNYSYTRYQKDIQKLQKVRQIVTDLMQKGAGDKLGYSYSWLDRLKILSDVAPTSKEFKEAKEIVEQQIKYGELNQTEIDKYKEALKIRQARIRKYELYPLRFKGQVLSPSSELNLQSYNKNIKAADQYSLPARVIGSMWERFTNTNQFIINKILAFKDPIEHYKMTRLYGKEYKPWDEPVKSWAEPLVRGLASKTNPIGGGMSWGTTGFIMGGHVGGVLGGAIGSIWGGAHGMYRGLINTGYIPNIIKDQRRIEEYFDQAKYDKNIRMSQLTAGLVSQEFRDQAAATLFALQQEEGTIANLFRATPFREKPYIESWLNTTDPDQRKEILKIAPKSIGSILKEKWNKYDQRTQTDEFVKNSSNDLLLPRERFSYDRSLMDPSVELDDIKLKVLQEHGYDEHEFGLGWNEQMLRMQQNSNNINTSRVNLNETTELKTPNISSSQVRGTIQEMLNKAGIKSHLNVYINEYEDDFNFINITIRRDKSTSVLSALENREKYME